MKIITKQFGEIEFDEKIIIEFKDGILGFEQLRKYLLLTEENSIFFWLTSVDEPEIVFPLIPVNLLLDKYPDKDGYEAFGIVKLNREPTKITANLKAPVYINQDNYTGVQKILDDDKFQINYQLFVEKED